MSSGYGYIGGVEAAEHYHEENDAVVTVGVRECWTSDCNYVEVMIGGLEGHDQLVLLDMGNDEARQLGNLLLEAAREVPILQPTNKMEEP